MKNHFQTEDLALATFLRLKGLELSDVFRLSRDRATFSFEDTAERPQRVSEFYNRDGSVEPLGFIATLRLLKKMAAESNNITLNEIKGENRDERES